MNPINFNNNYQLITLPVESFLDGLLKGGNEKNVIAFLKKNVIDLNNIPIQLEFAAPVLSLEYCKGRGSLVHYFTLKGWYDGLQHLFEQGCCFNKGLHKNRYWTPLFIAFSQGNHEMMSFLLDHGADINLPIPKAIYNSFNRNLSANLSQNYIVDVIFPNSLAQVVCVFFGNQSDWQNILCRNELKVTIGMLYYSHHHKNYSLFKNYLAKFTGDINELILGPENLLSIMIGNYGKSFEDNQASSIKMIQLLLKHPDVNLKYIDLNGYSVYQNLIFYYPKSRHSEIAKHLHEITNGFGELLNLQTMQFNKMNSALKARVHNRTRNFNTSVTTLVYKEISESLNGFLSIQKNHYPFFEKALKGILWPHLTCFNKISSYVNAINQGRIVVMDSGWKGQMGSEQLGHSVGAVFFKHQQNIYVMICNRGSGTTVDTSGIVMYSILNKEDESCTITKIIKLFQLQSLATKQFLTTTIKTFPLLKEIHVFQHKSQRSPNCSWITPKTTVRACMFAAWLNSGENTVDATQFSYSNYKTWSKYDRFHYSINKLLDHPYSKTPLIQRESEGILLSKILLECYLKAPNNFKEMMLQTIKEKLAPAEFEMNFSQFLTPE